MKLSNPGKVNPSYKQVFKHLINIRDSNCTQTTNEHETQSQTTFKSSIYVLSPRQLYLNFPQLEYEPLLLEPNSYGIREKVRFFKGVLFILSGPGSMKFFETKKCFWHQTFLK